MRTVPGKPTHISGAQNFQRGKQKSSDFCHHTYKDLHHLVSANFHPLSSTISSPFPVISTTQPQTVPEPASVSCLGCLPLLQKNCYQPFNTPVRCHLFCRVVLTSHVRLITTMRLTPPSTLYSTGCPCSSAAWPHTQNVHLQPGLQTVCSGAVWAGPCPSTSISTMPAAALGGPHGLGKSTE